MERKPVIPTARERAVQPGTPPAELGKVGKPGAGPIVGPREMENKTVTPTSRNRRAEANAKPAASNKVAKPNATDRVFADAVRVLHARLELPPPKFARG